MGYVNRVNKKDQKIIPVLIKQLEGMTIVFSPIFVFRYLIVEILRENSTRAQLDYLWLLVD